MYQLPSLSYLYQDLEPFIDTHTMGLHYHKHEQTYLNNLNNLLNKNNYDYKYDLNELIYHIEEFSLEDRETILFNLGGVLNHNIYWKSMNKNNTLPSGELKEQIDKQFGGYDEFWKEIKENALKLKGSGYTFLVMSNNELEIINFFNQDSPLLYGYIPLFNIDLWEHAYYINYENDRLKYIDNFKEIADFSYANEIYNKNAQNF